MNIDEIAMTIAKNVVQDALFEPNTSKKRKKIWKKSRKLWKTFGLSPLDAIIICDDDNNPPEKIIKNELHYRMFYRSGFLSWKKIEVMISPSEFTFNVEDDA